MGVSVTRYRERLVVFTDGGLDDAVALYFLLDSEIVRSRFLESPDRCIDIRCVSGCVTAEQAFENTLRVLTKAGVREDANIYVSVWSAPYESEIEPWDGYGTDGVLGLLEGVEPFIRRREQGIDEQVSAESCVVLGLAPYTFLRDFIRDAGSESIRLVGTMGGNSETVPDDQIEFNKLLDQVAWEATHYMCHEREIPFFEATYEDCISWNEKNDVHKITSEYKMGEDFQDLLYRYEDRMLDLGLDTACYDLIAAIEFERAYEKVEEDDGESCGTDGIDKVKVF